MAQRSLSLLIRPHGRLDSSQALMTPALALLAISAALLQRLPAAAAQSCDKDVVPGSCPYFWPFLPATYRGCRFSASACPVTIDPLYQNLQQGGFTVLSWPQVQRVVGQPVTITCGATVGCSTASTGYVGTACTPGEFGGSHAANSQESTASATMTGGVDNIFTLTLDTSGLLSGAHRICIDIDGTGTLAKFEDTGMTLKIA
mmetsp:Transcript_107208/g.195044  ORF Transcript_107208/g.195044 Transcript_107208/m.195044 type:complete len:202 (+) Transcript_107208:2-607(+)